MQVVISEDRIREGVADLARRIAADYDGKNLTVLGVLTGSIIFLADLIRQIDHPLQVGLLQASSYRGDAKSPGNLIVNSAFLPDVRGRDVLLLDDIFDTGTTLAVLLEKVRELQPRSVRSAVLLWKEGRQKVEITPDYHCFKIPNLFVVGYGLDFNDEYRNLPFIGVPQTG
ncbi:MAG: hypoxanthine phosphoribosyltransferase [Planctomycetales bacterium]|nr:hypoxanthine phosphoribosyltransferase [Planctomycetales bacterium]